MLNQIAYHAKTQDLKWENYLPVPHWYCEVLHTSSPAVIGFKSVKKLKIIFFLSASEVSFWGRQCVGDRSSGPESVGKPCWCSWMVMADADVVADADADANVVADADADAASAGCGWEATTAGCWDGGLQGETSGRKGGCCLIREDDGHLFCTDGRWPHRKSRPKGQIIGYNVEIENKALKMASFLTISFG